jgi:P-loop Domain of unknown function (DUF2791)
MMPAQPRAGERVETVHFGPGVVTRVAKGGALVRLDGFGGYEIEVPLADLATTHSAPLAVAEEPAPAPTSAPVAGELAARRAIEALRFGLVPREHIEELTLGFADLAAWTRANLPCAAGGGPRLAAITGPFGAGKSHTMAVVRYVAQRAGYLTARVEVDGQSITLAKPETFLYQLWNTLAGADFQSATPVLDLYLRAIDAGQAAPAIVPEGMDRVRQNYTIVRELRRRGTLDAQGYAVDALLASSTEFNAAEVTRLVGGRIRFPEGRLALRRMLGNSVAERPYDLVATLAGHALIARLAGFQGLVVTIDEFEVEQAPSPANFARVRQVLAVLAAYLRGETAYPAAPLGLCFATVGEDEHGGDAAIGALLAATGGAHYALEPWPPAQRRELARRLYDLYRAAYALAQDFAGPAAAAADRLEARFAAEGLDDSRLIRAFIKRYVGALDLLYGPPRA